MKRRRKRLGGFLCVVVLVVWNSVFVVVLIGDSVFGCSWNVFMLMSVCVRQSRIRPLLPPKHAHKGIFVRCMHKLALVCIRTLTASMINLLPGALTSERLYAIVCRTWQHEAGKGKGGPS